MPESTRAVEPDPDAPALMRSCSGPQVFSADDLRRAHTRIAHEIVERNHGADDLILVGLYTAGSRHRPPPRRGDRVVRRGRGAGRHPRRRVLPRRHRPAPRSSPSGPPRSRSTSADQVVVLVDDVLFTGRTIRAALDALTELGRARAVQLAVLVDRGHRELPIRADFVGKNLPTREAEDVRVRLHETDDVTDVIELWGPAGGAQE